MIRPGNQLLTDRAAARWLPTTVLWSLLRSIKTNLAWL